MSSAEKLTILLEQLAPWFKAKGRGSVTEIGMYQCALRASITKAYEYAVYLRTQPKQLDFYFSTATLRGICEDYIALSFLETLPISDRDSLVSALLQANADEGFRAQESFFGKVRPWQPVVKSRKASSALAHTETIGHLAAKYKWERKRWPTVRFMAQKSSLTELYEYIYSVTSKWVHFSPHLLMRMGWGGSEDQPVSRDTEWEFSTRNFADYYREFSQFYSVYLMVLLLRKFGPGIGEFTSMSQIVDEIETYLNNRLYRK